MNNINSEKFLKELSNRIKKRREELGLSYTDISNATGLSRSTLLRYENGRIKNIPVDRVEILARVLKMNPIQMMGWDMDLEVEELSENEKLLISNFRELNIKGKNKVKEYIDDMIKIDEYTMRIQITSTTSNSTCMMATNPSIYPITRRANNDKQYDDREQELMNEDFEMMRKWKEDKK